MKFHGEVTVEDRERIAKALEDIGTHGDRFHRRLSRFIEASSLSLYVGPAKEVGGSGSTRIGNAFAARVAVGGSELSMFDAAGFVRLNIARETIDTGGQRGIEGTLVHEGKHAADFSLMLSTFSSRQGIGQFNPTAYQREYSAHLTSAFYLRIRGGEYAQEGVGLGLLETRQGELAVSAKGIRRRLENGYGLTPSAPGATLDRCSFPRIKPFNELWFGVL